MRVLWLIFPLIFLAQDAAAQTLESKRRWEVMAQIRRDKFDYILPEVMRENGVDMWITVVREGRPDPLTLDLGEGYVSSIGYYIFTDQGGDRIERAALGISGYRIQQSGAYDHIGAEADFKQFVHDRNPQTIALNMSKSIGAADGLSYTDYHRLTDILGAEYAERFVSGEKMISDFRSRRVATEIIAFGEAAEISRQIAERAFSNEVITPGVTTLEDVAWWMTEQQFERGLGSSFGMPSVYITGPGGIEAVSTDRIIQRGDLLMIDWGVGLMNFYTDMKRIAYVLQEGEIEPPAGIQNAFDRALEVREVVRRTIKPYRRANETMDAIHAALEDAGFAIMKVFNRPTSTPKTEVIIGCHSVGNLGHGIGPSIATFNPQRLTYEIRPTNLLSIEFFAYTAAEEWGGRKVRIPLEDDAVVTERGVEWLAPPNPRILLIK